MSTITLAHDLTPEQLATLEREGYRPIIRWQHANTTCTDGEALKNIEIEAKRATCDHAKHGRGGINGDACRNCGKIVGYTR